LFTHHVKKILTLHFAEKRRDVNGRNRIKNEMNVFWDVAPYSLVGIIRRFRGSASIIRAIIALIMKALSTSETSVNSYQITRSNIPEGSHLQSRRRENLKSHPIKMSLAVFSEDVVVVVVVVSLTTLFQHLRLYSVDF
jgi:hypothetical protein